jgi:putative membrane protein
VLVVIGACDLISVSGDLFVLLLALPSIIGFGGYYVRRFSQSPRYTIAASQLTGTRRLRTVLHE